MTFDELIKRINDDNRYSLLLTHADLIILEVGKTSQDSVAKKLGLHPTAFSPMYKLIKAKG